jgi:hypothetical protein
MFGVDNVLHLHMQHIQKDLAHAKRLHESSKTTTIYVLLYVHSHALTYTDQIWEAFCFFSCLGV